ncbi:hypothetical protein EG487_14725 [Paenibacillus polymyxa]|nr:hypothetical protein EG487_14725 [Paenibacillus polymyxa]
MLTITVNNDVPVAGSQGSYSSDYENAKYARGTLVWDSREGEFSVQVPHLFPILYVNNSITVKYTVLSNVHQY